MKLNFVSSKGVCPETAPSGTVIIEYLSKSKGDNIIRFAEGYFSKEMPQGWYTKDGDLALVLRYAELTPLLECRELPKFIQEILDYKYFTDPNLFRFGSIGSIDKIEDFSFSGLVNEIEGDSDTASDVLDILARQLAEEKENIRELEFKLNCANSNKTNIIVAAQRIVEKILRKNLPLVVMRNGYIVVVTDKNISSENNVI